MADKSLWLMVSMIISMDAFFDGEDTFMNHFDEFDTIINHMKSFRQELKDFENNIHEQTVKNSSRKPHIQLINNAKDVTAIIANIALPTTKEVDATVLYDHQEKPYALKIDAGEYNIEINYDHHNRYVSMSIVYQSSSKQKEKESQPAQSIHYSIRKGQTVLSPLDLEAVTVEIDNTKKSINIAIPKVEEKTKHKKITVKEVSTQ
jgi:hypothetical protein